MVLLFLIVLFFVCYVSLLGCNLSKEEVVRKNVFFLCCTLVITAFIVYFVKRDEVSLDFSLGAFFALAIGPLLLLLLKEKKSRLIIHFIPIIILFGFNTWCSFYSPNLYNSYLPYVDQILFLGVVLSCSIYGGYGYIYMVRKELNFVDNSMFFCYTALVLSCAFFFGVLFFRSRDAFDIDYGYMIYCLSLMLVACLNEFRRYWSIVYLTPIRSELANMNFFILALGSEQELLEEVDTIDKTPLVNKDVAEQKEIYRMEKHNKIRSELFSKLILSELYLQSDLTLLKLTKVVDIERSELADYFKNSSASSFRQYVNRLKVEHAINLINQMNKDITVEELTVFCGFNTRLSFYRAFVHVYGFPPSSILNN